MTRHPDKTDALMRSDEGVTGQSPAQPWWVLLSLNQTSLAWTRPQLVQAPGGLAVGHRHEDPGGAGARGPAVDRTPRWPGTGCAAAERSQGGTMWEPSFHCWENPGVFNMQPVIFWVRFCRSHVGHVVCLFLLQILSCIFFWCLSLAPLFFESSFSSCFV